MNALTRAANGYGAAQPANGELSHESNGNGNGNGYARSAEIGQTQFDPSSPATATALETDDTTMRQAAEAAQAEAAEVEEAAAIDFLII